MHIQAHTIRLWVQNVPPLLQIISGLVLLNLDSTCWPDSSLLHRFYSRMKSTHDRENRNKHARDNSPCCPVTISELEDKLKWVSFWTNFQRFLGSSKAKWNIGSHCIGPSSSLLSRLAAALQGIRLKDCTSRY